MNFFADSEKDIEEVSGGKSFISNNGINYGAPLSSSTIVITYPDKTKKTYVLSEDGNWYAGGANPGSKVEVNTKNWDIHYPELETISVDGETYRTDGIMVHSDSSTHKVVYISYNGDRYGIDNVSVNQNTEGQNVHNLRNLVLNGEYFDIANDGVTSIGGVKGDITLGPQLSISNYKEISVNIEANAETTQDNPELTSLKIADNVYKIPSSNNVLILEGEYVENEDYSYINVKVASYAEGEAIADRFKKGDTIRISYTYKKSEIVTDVILCDDSQWCGLGNLSYFYIYVFAGGTMGSGVPSLTRVYLVRA